MQEQQFAAEIKAWTMKVSASQAELTRLTAENTACLNAVADLTKTQREMEKALTVGAYTRE